MVSYKLDKKKYLHYKNLLDKVYNKESFQKSLYLKTVKKGKFISELKNDLANKPEKFYEWRKNCMCDENYIGLYRYIVFRSSRKKESLKKELSVDRHEEEFSALVKSSKELKLLDHPPLIVSISTRSYRSVHITVSDHKGKVLKAFTSGKLNYKKAARHKHLSLADLLDDVKFFLYSSNVKKYKFCIYLKGLGFKTNKILRIFLKSSLRKFILSIVDLSGLPFNGCRPKKLRRK